MELYKVKCCATCKKCEIAYNTFGDRMYLCRNENTEYTYDSNKMTTIVRNSYYCCDAWQPGYGGEYR